MDSSDGSLCLNDIRSLRLAVNDLKKWVRDICPKGGLMVLGSPPFSPSSSIATRSTVGSTSTEVSPIFHSNPSQTTTMSTTMGPLVSLKGEGWVYEEVNRLSELEALATLSLASLAVWLALVMLALTWMRLTDLRYKPVVVS